MRTITNDDINSAARGLGMWRQPIAYLDHLVEVHGAQDAFASKVIAEAARQVKLARVVLRAGLVD